MTIYPKEHDRTDMIARFDTVHLDIGAWSEEAIAFVLRDKP